MIAKLPRIVSLLMIILLCSCSPQKRLGKDINGNSINLADYPNKWIVINYWASWCRPCYTELPALNAFYHSHKAHDVVVFAVNYEKLSPEKQRAFAKKYKIDFIMLASDPAKKLGLKRPDSLPVTFLISPTGTLKEELIGPQTQQDLEIAMGLPSLSNSGATKT